MNQKKILIISEYFYPEEFKINELVRTWKQKGYHVDIVTTVPTYPLGEVFPEYTNRWFQKELYQGITVYRVKAVTGYKHSLFKKVLKYISFMILGSLVSFKIAKKYDYVFGFDVGALTGMVPAILLKKFFNIPVTLWIQDIWPDSIYAYGFKKSKLLSLTLDMFVRFVYKHTDQFAISAQGFKQKIVPYLDSPKTILYAPNWADHLYDSIETFAFSHDNKIHFTFAGNIGKVQNLENIIIAFSDLKEPFASLAQLNIIGDGSHLSHLKELVEKNNIQNVVFHGKKPRTEISKYLSASHFLIVSLKNDPIFSLTVPSKVQTYIAAQKPIIAVIHGEAADLVTKHELGYVAHPDDLQEITSVLMEALKADQTTIDTFTKNCELLTDTLFKEDTIINNLLELTLTHTNVKAN